MSAVIDEYAEDSSDEEVCILYATSVINPDVVFIKVAYFVVVCVYVCVCVHASVHACASFQSCMCVMLDLTHCSHLCDDTHLMLVTVHTYYLYIFSSLVFTVMLRSS